MSSDLKPLSVHPSVFCSKSEQVNRLIECSHMSES